MLQEGLGSLQVLGARERAALARRVQYKALIALLPDEHCMLSPRSNVGEKEREGEE